MENTKEIVKKITQLITPLSDEAIAKLSTILIRTELKKNEQFLKEGEVFNQIAYIEKGMVRQFYYKNNRELTEFFAYDNNMIISIESSFLRKPSQLIIEALENSVIYGILYNKLKEFIKEDLELAEFYRKILEGSLILSQRRIDSFRLESATERYTRLLKEHPEIIRRAPLADIASYLLMTPETLSRVRASI
ncbi:Crp/Fnr family transcriptional regulator [Parabacteroides sp. OttesenSCG-928-G07]|nr:Crp/Fnr family transcriptional regulator [Parabacteroides sp. OttesenSCG-928-G07]